MPQRTLGLNFSFTSMFWQLFNPQAPDAAPGRCLMMSHDQRRVASRVKYWRREMRIGVYVTYKSLTPCHQIYCFSSCVWALDLVRHFTRPLSKHDQPSSQRSSGVLLLPECSFCPGIQSPKGTNLAQIARSVGSMRVCSHSSAEFRP